MKVFFGVALLCCFFVGSFSSAVRCTVRECKNFEDCACQNPDAIKAKILSDKPIEIGEGDTPWKEHVDELVYKIKTLQTYKPSQNKFKYLVVPKACNWNALGKGKKFYFFGSQLNDTNYKKYLKIGEPLGYKKYMPNASKAQRKFMRKLRNGEDVC